VPPDLEQNGAAERAWSILRLSAGEANRNRSKALQVFRLPMAPVRLCPGKREETRILLPLSDQRSLAGEVVGAPALRIETSTYIQRGKGSFSGSDLHVSGTGEGLCRAGRWILSRIEETGCAGLHLRDRGIPVIARSSFRFTRDAHGTGLRTCQLLLLNRLLDQSAAWKCWRGPAGTDMIS
jgi:hypothetical protein